MAWYTIHYEADGGAPAAMGMHFPDKGSALDNACELLKAGIAVSKVEGPDFRIRRTALDAFYRSRAANRK
jgi:hypothetical protein